MAYVASPEEQARYLRRLENAAANAIGNGCTVEQAREAFETGIRAELETRGRVSELDAAAGGPPLATAPVWEADRGATPALAALTDVYR